MAGQLIYTSAPQGLAAGQSGYCTVARDGELREALIRALEQLSSFNHAASAGQHNPVISAYRVLDLRGAKFHVLSKIQDSGLDFTNRTNHLAHHLVFEPHEVEKLPSPALIFRDWNGWRKEWKESPRFLGSSDWGNLAQIPLDISLPAKNWQSVTGDAGSAAALLERAFANGAFLLGSAEILPALFAESVQLLSLKGKSRSLFWEYTFTSRLQPEDNPHDFRWRGCQSDSPAYQAVLRKGGSFTAVNSIKAPANDLAQYARTGKLPEPEIRVVTATPFPRPATVRPEPVPLRGWSPVPANFENKENDEEAQKQTQSHGWIWISMVVIVLAAAGAWAWAHSHNQSNTNSKAPNTLPTNNATAVVAQTPAPPVVTPSPAPAKPPSNPTEKWVTRLPDFNTWLVNLSSDSSMTVDNVDDLKTVCALLQQKECMSQQEIKAHLECRARAEDFLGGNESPTNGIISLFLPDLHGKTSELGFKFDGWRSFTPTEESIGVYDFSSPSNEFKRFRIVSFPANAHNRPVKFPKLLLRANQGNLMDSFDTSLANRLRRIKPYGGDFLQLRPYVKDKGNGNPLDMVDMLTWQAAKTSTTKGHELNFIDLRKLLTNEIDTTTKQKADAQKNIDDLTGQEPGLLQQINNQTAEYNKAPDDPGKLAALTASKQTLAENRMKISQAKYSQKVWDNNLKIYHNCLDQVPDGLDDPKLDHVDLVLAPAAQSKADERIQLIRFEDSEETK